MPIKRPAGEGIGWDTWNKVGMSAITARSGRTSCSIQNGHLSAHTKIGSPCTNACALSVAYFQQKHPWMSAISLLFALWAGWYGQCNLKILIHPHALCGRTDMGLGRDIKHYPINQLSQTQTYSHNDPYVTIVHDFRMHDIIWCHEIRFLWFNYCCTNNQWVKHDNFILENGVFSNFSNNKHDFQYCSNVCQNIWVLHNLW